MRLFLLSWLFIIFSTTISAEKLNIITDSKTAFIAVNNQVVAKGELINYTIAPGTYLVTVEDQGIKIFSEIIEVEKEKVKTLNVNVGSQLSKEVVSLKDKQKYARYVLDKEKGKLGLGVYMNGRGLSGVKASYDLPFQVTAQSLFWMDSSNSNEIFTVGVVIKYFKGQYTKHTLARLYTGVGALYGENNEDQIINLDIPVGIEFKFRDNVNSLPAYSVFVLGYFGWLYNLAVTIDGMYYYLESGLTYNDISNGDYFMGVKLATGFQYYF